MGWGKRHGPNGTGQKAEIGAPLNLTPKKPLGTNENLERNEKS